MTAITPRLRAAMNKEFVLRRAFSTSIFARHQGSILLIHHHRLKEWLPVGGELLPGETPLECARRELLEETGLVGEFTDLQTVEGTPPGLLVYEEHVSGSKGQHLNFCFVADVPTRAITANHEFTDFCWVDKPLHDNCPLNVQQVIRLALGHQADTTNLLAERWIDAFNRHDVTQLVALYAEDAQHVTPKLRAQNPSGVSHLQGKAALSAWWSAALQRNPHLHYHLNHATRQGRRIWMHYDRINPGEATYPVAELLVLGDADLIVRSEVFHGG